jgi:hypothetical protein
MIRPVPSFKADQEAYIVPRRLDAERWRGAQAKRRMSCFWRGLVGRQAKGVSEDRIQSSTGDAESWPWLCENVVLSMILPMIPAGGIMKGLVVESIAPRPPHLLQNDLHPLALAVPGCQHAAQVEHHGNLLKLTIRESGAVQPSAAITSSALLTADTFCRA